MSVVRLYVDQPLGAGQSVSLTREQAHYLFGVMRLGEGAKLRLFNGVDGEYVARVETASKRGAILISEDLTRRQEAPPDLWLLFAPIKKARTDFIVEKATEMGAARICPVRTEFTNSERVRCERLQAHAIEAAEQCGGIVVPEVPEIASLSAILDDWPENRALIFCDEAMVDCEATPEVNLPAAPVAILIGPEGGFSEAERARLNAMPEAMTMSLGPRILRADTAAVAALTLWQSAAGDWK